jgi:hypothetical protein
MEQNKATVEEYLINISQISRDLMILKFKTPRELIKTPCENLTAQSQFRLGLTILKLNKY